MTDLRGRLIRAVEALDTTIHLGSARAISDHVCHAEVPDAVNAIIAELGLDHPTAELIDAARSDYGVHLDKILGLDIHDEIDRSTGRVAAFTIRDNTVVWSEACDDWFSVSLTRTDIDRVIAFLTALRPHAPETLE